MTKSELLKELKGMWNSEKTVGGIKVAYCAWHCGFGWKVLSDDKTSWKERTYKSIIDFKTQNELATYISNNTK